MSTTLMKLEGTSGNLKEMTVAEEAYIAYQVAAYLASSTHWSNSDTGTIINSTDIANQPVGSFSDTYYNQAIGTHPGSSLTTGTTTTTLKQNTTARIETGLVYPIYWDIGNVSEQTGVHEMTSSDFDTVCDRILAYIMANEWPGSLRIATSTPADYELFRSSVFSDTRADGTVGTYNLYKKTTLPTMPTVIRPMRLEGTEGSLKEMTDEEIQLSFGQRVMNRMISANDRVGRYYLGTTAPTNAGYTGTWLSRGTITDTRHTTSETNYAATYTGNYTSISVGNYIGDFVGDFARTFFSTRFSARISAIRVPPWFDGHHFHVAFYSGGFTGFFAATGFYTRNSTRNSTVNYTGDFVGDYVGDYVGTTLVNTAPTNINTYTLYVRSA